MHTWPYTNGKVISNAYMTFLFIYDSPTYYIACKHNYICMGESYHIYTWVDISYIIQRSEDPFDASSCRSFPAKEPLIIGLFCGKWPIKIRHPMGLRHLVSHSYMTLLHICDMPHKWHDQRMTRIHMFHMTHSKQLRSVIWVISYSYMTLLHICVMTHTWHDRWMTRIHMFHTTYSKQLRSVIWVISYSYMTLLHICDMPHVWHDRWMTLIHIFDVTHSKQLRYAWESCMNVMWVIAHSYMTLLHICDMNHAWNDRWKPRIHMFDLTHSKQLRSAIWMRHVTHLHH